MIGKDYIVYKNDISIIWEVIEYHKGIYRTKNKYGEIAIYTFDEIDKYYHIILSDDKKGQLLFVK